MKQLLIEFTPSIDVDRYGEKYTYKTPDKSNPDFYSCPGISSCLILPYDNSTGKGLKLNWISPYGEEISLVKLPSISPVYSSQVINPGLLIGVLPFTEPRCRTPSE